MEIAKIQTRNEHWYEKSLVYIHILKFYHYYLIPH